MMFTPRGELKEGMLELFQDRDKLNQLQQCSDKTQLMSLLNQFLDETTFDELQNSVIVIQSYLEEEQKTKALRQMEADQGEAAIDYTGRLVRNKIEIMLEDQPDSCVEILRLFRKIDVM